MNFKQNPTATPTGNEGHKLLKLHSALYQTGNEGHKLSYTVLSTKQAMRATN